MPIEILGRKQHRFSINLSDENAGASRIALLLPGVGYRLENPIFYFVRQLLIDQGYQIAAADYAYDKVEGFRDLSFEEIMDILKDDATSIGEALNQLPDHNSKLVIGKSLGTVLMADLLDQGFTSNAQLAWLTPSSKVSQVPNNIQKHAEKSFVCIGTADKGYDHEVYQTFAKAGATVTILEDLAHVLECEKDVPKSILGHHKMCTDLQNWLKANA